MTQQELRRSSGARSVPAVLALAVASLFALGAEKTGGTNVVWPIVGIVAALIIIYVVSRFVRGDPDYEKNAERDRRDSGAVPWSGGEGS